MFSPISAGRSSPRSARRRLIVDGKNSLIDKQTPSEEDGVWESKPGVTTSMSSHLNEGRPARAPSIRRSAVVRRFRSQRRLFQRVSGASQISLPPPSSVPPRPVSPASFPSRSRIDAEPGARPPRRPGGWWGVRRALSAIDPGGKKNRRFGVQSSPIFLYLAVFLENMPYSFFPAALHARRTVPPAASGMRRDRGRCRLKGKRSTTSAFWRRFALNPAGYLVGPLSATRKGPLILGGLALILHRAQHAVA